MYIGNPKGRRLTVFISKAKKGSNGDSIQEAQAKRCEVVKGPSRSLCKLGRDERNGESADTCVSAPRLARKVKCEGQKRTIACVYVA